MENRIVCADCLSALKDIESGTIDLVVSSPPYAKQRKETYGGVEPSEFPSWLTKVGKEIHRVLKDTGSFVLNIKEHVDNGARNTYVLKTVLSLAEIFIWSDTFIWNKTNPFPTGSKKRLKDGFEYCYFFTKTNNYIFRPENVLVKTNSKWLAGEKRRKNKGEHKVTNGSKMNMSKRYVSEMVRPSNVVTLPVDTTNHEHPATFPVGLPYFFIKLLTNPEGVVLDPFMGSGTTLVAARRLNRKYIGIDINEKYVEAARKRVESEPDGWLFECG